MRKFYLLANLLICSLIGTAQNVGIGTTTPHTTAFLHVDVGISDTKGFLVTGNSQTASPSSPNLGPGNRLMFYPGKAAFRAGYVGGAQWDNVNVGRYSAALGASSTASGDVSIATGSGTVASGVYSTAMGLQTTASGVASTTIGYNTAALGFGSTAMGEGTAALGDNSTAMGKSTVAGGLNSTAMGFLSTAMGDYSTAVGYNTSASGILSFAAGTNVSTNNKRGSFFFGDGDPNQKGIRPIGFADQFAARFNGGYYFISNDAGADIGVQVLAGGNSWVVMSDVRFKENILPVNGEAFLQKISKLHLTSWNYKTQDSKTFRHYGPMAQEFYAAFGKDGYGTIGNDTTINQADFDGVNLIAIQALEKRTASLQKENEELKARLEKLEMLIAKKQ